MKIAKNVIWRFFASVKLALITLIILAAASIIGTLIKQGQESSYYVQEYGPSLARLFEILDIPKMYSSWWFFSLLSLFAINLVVCSIERLPGAWHMVKLDNLSTDPEQLEKMSSTHRIDSSLAVGAAADRLNQLLAWSGWKRLGAWILRDLYFAQKGA
jgi:cytochrome c biogenesis protein